MTTEKVNDLELVKLSDYFTPGKFRTIPGTAMTDRGGITEMQAVFNINTDKSKYVGYKEENVLKRITFNDCGERFVMVLELSDAPDKLLAVTADDVEYLLNNCLHPAT